jgi:hypothetical protein
MPWLAWCSHSRRKAAGSSPRSPAWSAIIVATIGTTSLKTLRPSWTNSLSALPSPSGAARLRKPKLLRMLLENTVFSRVPTISQYCAGARLMSSTSTAVATFTNKITSPITTATAS